MKKHVILFLAANPRTSNRRQLAEECADIQRELKMSPHRDDFQFESRWAVSVDELMRHLNELAPTVIHFSGRGGTAGLMLEDERGRPQPVSARALTMMVGTTARNARVVVLNACYTAAQADALRAKVDCVVGMVGAISDEAARAFAIRLYGALANCRSVGNAVDQGVAALAAKQLQEEQLPCCVTREGIDKYQVSLEARRAVNVREQSGATKPSRGASAPEAIAHGEESPLTARVKVLSPSILRPATRPKVADLPLGQFFVWWNDLTRGSITRFQRQLAQATREQDVQAFLEREPMMLVQHLGGGHGRWVIPRKRLGAEHVTDFMIGERDSAGWGWQAVELESPHARMFTKNGDPTAQLTHAIRQIEDWRDWLTRNASYAARDLGLTDVRPDLPGLVLIGRRANEDPATKNRLRQMMVQRRIQIHTYDFLLDNARGRIEFAIARRKRRRAR